MTQDPRIGTRFAGRYDIVGHLGQGGMGVVYEARHAFTSREVAVKILHSVVARSAHAREQFLREAQASTSDGHPAWLPDDRRWRGGIHTGVSPPDRAEGGCRPRRAVTMWPACGWPASGADRRKRETP